VGFTKLLESWPVVRQVRDGDLLGTGKAAQSERTRALRPRLERADHVGHSVCPYCAVGCAQLVYVENGEVTQIEGDPASALRIYKALQPLGARLEPAEVIEATVAATFELLPRATHVAILLRSDADKDRFALAVSRSSKTVEKSAEARPDPVRASRAVLRRVLADRAAVLTANAQEALSSESILGGQILSILALPLWRGDDIIGLIQSDNRATAGMFSETDLEVGLLLAAQASLAIDNATLVQRLRVAEERARGENVYLRRKEHKIKFDNIIGDSQAIRRRC